MLEFKILTVQFSLMVVIYVDRFKSGTSYTVNKCSILHVAAKEHFF